MLRRGAFASIAAIRAGLDELIGPERDAGSPSPATCSRRRAASPRSVAAPAADAVDRDARFPHEAIAALREERMLGALRAAASWAAAARRSRELAAVCEVLGRACASTAMIFAMHQIEVACLVRHGLASPFFRDYLAELARHQWLIASATSEIGVGGDLRRSICAVERDGRAFA